MKIVIGVIVDERNVYNGISALVVVIETSMYAFAVIMT